MDLSFVTTRGWAGEQVRKNAVLIIEDMESISSSLKRAIEFQFPEISVRVADSRKEALDFLAKERFAAVIADYGLLTSRISTGENPLAAIFELQPQTKMLLMSGSDEKTVRSALGSEPDYAFFQKPFSVQALFSFFKNLGW